jgi:aspartate 1-decarboxylase
MLKSKIHRACVTDVNLDYNGSITIDRRLMEEADILPYEQVQVLNLNNGSRFITYAIEGEQGEVCISSADTALAAKGDAIIILSYNHVDESEAHNAVPRVVYVDSRNDIAEQKEWFKSMTLLEAE